MKTKQIKKETDNKVKVIFVVFVLLHILFAIYLGTQKINYHYDEWLTFGLANNTLDGVNIENGKIYNGFSLYKEYLSVKSNEKFDYRGVWENQAKDVHPPFYYVIIHTICSFFSGKSSKWFGILPNVFFMVLIDFLLFKLSKCILKDKWLALIVTIVAGTSMLNMNMVIFIRMYEMMTFFVVGITLLFSIYFNRDKDWKFYVWCYLFTVGGIMTQYYFLIYLFFLCLFLGIHLLIQRKWKEICWCMLTFAMAGGSCITIFPSMLTQIFGDNYRGRQAFSAARTLRHYGEYLKNYYGILNNNLFGGMLDELFLVLVLLAILVGVKKGKNCMKGMDTAPVMMLFAGILYVIVIAKVAPYRTERYVMPVGWIFILVSIWFLYKSISVIMNKQNKPLLVGGIFAVFVMMSWNSLRMVDWQYHYTYANYKEVFNLIEQYEDCSAVCVYKKRRRTVCNAEELRGYKEYAFANSKEVVELVKKMNTNQMILYVIDRSDEDELIETILQSNNQLDHAEFLFESGYAKVYYLE